MPRTFASEVRGSLPSPSAGGIEMPRVDGHSENCGPIAISALSRHVRPPVRADFARRKKPARRFSAFDFRGAPFFYARLFARRRRRRRLRAAAINFSTSPPPDFYLLGAIAAGGGERGLRSR